KRLQRKLMAVHTMDDALQGIHQENTVSNPTYVVPVRRSHSHDDHNIEDEEDEGEGEEEEDEGGRLLSREELVKSRRPIQLHGKSTRARYQRVPVDEFDDGLGNSAVGSRT
ncbi:hypothetical protein BGZ94_009240, partial [Podila epigama]